MLKIQAIGLLFVFQLALGADWFPVAVKVDGVLTQYAPQARASKPWRICALLPHGKDKYWWGVSWGLQEEAARQSIKLGIYQAGGYENLAVQRTQFQSCVKQGTDAIILAGITADGLNGDIQQASAQGIPVIDLINGVSSPLVTSRAMVSFADMLPVASAYIIKHSQGKLPKVVWFPGPAGAAWVQDAETGMNQALKGKVGSVVHAGYAPTDNTSQMNLVRAFFEKNQADFVLANAVAARSAEAYLWANKITNSKVVSFYSTDVVIDLIRQGRILAAPSDSPVLSSRIAIDLAVRAIEGKSVPSRVSPVIEIIDAKNVNSYDMSKLLPPKDYRLQEPVLPN